MIQRARVSELIDIRICDVRLDVPAVITLHGKGRKIRSVPLMKQTVDLLKVYFEENRIDPVRHSDLPLFWNTHRKKLTRSGVTYILRKYVEMAQGVSSDMPLNVSPHKLRHTKAMHLVQANVNPVTSRIFSAMRIFRLLKSMQGQTTKRNGLRWKRLLSI